MFERRKNTEEEAFPLFDLVEIPPEMSYSPLGVSAAFISEFFPQTEMYASTGRVFNATISRQTQRKRAFVELFEDKFGPDGRCMVGPATVFVSHSWQTPFKDLCDIITTAAMSDPSAYFWVDIFAQNMSVQTKGLPWRTEGTEKILTSVKTVMVCFPAWNKPFHERPMLFWELLVATQRAHPDRCDGSCERSFHGHLDEMLQDRLCRD